MTPASRRHDCRSLPAAPSLCPSLQPDSPHKHTMNHYPEHYHTHHPTWAKEASIRLVAFPTVTMLTCRPSGAGSSDLPGAEGARPALTAPCRRSADCLSDGVTP